MGAVLAPFVIGAEALGKLTMAFFGAAEKLNPGPLLQRMMRPLADLSMRLMRSLRYPLRPIEKALDRLFGFLLRLISPITTRIANVARRARTWAADVGRRVLRATQPFRTRWSTMWGTVRAKWRDATAPIRRVGRRVRERARVVKARLQRVLRE